MTRELDGADAEHLLKTLDMLVEAVDQYVDGDHNRHVDDSLWDDWAKALDVLRDYGLREKSRW